VALVAGKEKPIADRFVRVNERIRAREVRVVDEEGKQLGIMPPWEALKIARGRGLDLVEVSPRAVPPVCRIINYGKFLYQQSKRQHDARKHQRSIELKEVKFRPRTGEHDFEVKKNHILRFLQDGNKVKATIAFRGREMAHRDLGWTMMNRLLADVAEFGQVETRAKQEGPNLTAILAPKKVASKPGALQPRPAPAPIASVSAAAQPVGSSSPPPSPRENSGG
jgi:translation initiation factor IF-3